MISLNNVKITPTIFPDKTSQVWKLPETLINKIGPNDIVWLFEGESEIIHVAQLVDLVNTYSNLKPNLYIPYFPYARQDKDINNFSTFAGNTFIKLLNTLSANITTLDVHNPNLLINSKVRNITVNDTLSSFLNTKDFIVVFPDEGALTRYILNLYSYAFFKKERNQITGEIVSQELIFKNEILNKDVILIDDLADAGGTFIKAAKILLKEGARSVSLYVTHGLFTKGTQLLKDSGIHKIYTMDYNILEVKEVL